MQISTLLQNFDLKESKKIIKLAFPIFLGSIAAMGMAFTDTVMAGHFSAQDLAGIALATTFIITLTIAGSGFILAITPTISADHGASNYKKIHKDFYQIIFICLGLSIVTIILLALSTHLYSLFNIEERVYEVAYKYTLISLIGIPAFYIFNGIRALTEGMSYTKLTMHVSFIALILNVIFNYIFMYGKLGFPAMGGIGSAVATVFVQILMVISQLLLIKYIDHFKQLDLALKKFTFDYHVIKAFLKIGFPIALAQFFEIMFFTFLGIMVTYMGTIMIAANQIYFNLMSIIYMLPFSLSQVVSIRIGFSQGAHNPKQTLRSITTCYIMGFILSIISAVGSFLCRDYVGALYTNDPEVIAIVTGSFAIISWYQLADFCQIIGIGVLRGMQDNKIISYASIIVYWLIGIPISLILGFTNWLGGSYGFSGLWFGLCASLYILAMIYSTKVFLNIKKLPQ